MPQVFDGLSFKLTDEFIETYRHREPDWGYPDAAGNSLGEITFLRTYSRAKPDGTKERWYEVCRRVVEGMFSIQKDHVQANRLPWNDRKAHASAQEAYERLFTFKWTPPGRGLWMMGTPLVNVHKNSAALQNCAFVSTGDMNRVNPSAPFTFLMEASMLGIGVGFDTLGANKQLNIYQPHHPACVEPPIHVIPDSREGWVESVRLLLDSYLKPGQDEALYDYSLIRPAGEPIRTFGGTAAGPDPLMRLHASLRERLDNRDGQPLTTLDILDIANLIGVCVVSGNVRRSAELALGSIDDKEFLNAKHYGDWHQETETFEPGPAQYRKDWGWMSNNSVAVNVGDDLSPIIEGIARNGEPGVIWMDMSRKYGRLVDPPTNADYRVAGYNPCFAPDTIVETVEGPKRIADITAPTQVYTKGPDGKLAIRKASAAWMTRRNAETLRIHLRNGDSLVVTPEHKIMMRDGSWVEAKNLRPNDSLETLCRTRRGWRYSGVRLASQHPSEQVMEHRFIYEGVHGRITDGFDVDHINRDHHDNRLENLRALPHGEHASLSRSQVPNNHQIHGEHGDFVPSGLHGQKPKDGAIAPPRATGWINQHTVVAITEGPVTDVYDITVDETHCLIADGVVAHNCAEQSLESYECCTLVETNLNRHEDLNDYERTLKFAYLYAKTVTLLPTHWEQTNAIMQRNRRIGTGVSGLANFADRRGLTELRVWLDSGYATIQEYDSIYSEWLCVRPSIKTTTVKPSGTVSILAGESPGAHWSPGGRYFDRGIVFQQDDPIVTLLTAAGYPVEDSVYTPGTKFIQFPVQSLAHRSESDVTLFEKAHLAVTAQRYWSDNSVSVTLSFDPETEGEHVGTVLHMHEGALKTVSFLPRGNTVYQQMPYQQSDEPAWVAASEQLFKVDLSPIYDGRMDVIDAIGEAYCTTDACEIPKG